MPIPKNPETILIKNKFYPKGLKEIDIWNYYQLYKGPLLNETRGRDLMFAIATGTNEMVLKRKGSQTQFIRLTNSNYDEMMHGRVVAVYSTMRRYEDICVLDIDVDDFNKAKDAVNEIFMTLSKSPILSDATIRYSGKQSFHIVCNMGRKANIDSIKMVADNYLRKTDLVQKYTIEAKRRPGIPNIDLSPNKFRGAYITLNSLSIWGLKCMEVNFGRLSSFQQNVARIKVN